MRTFLILLGFILHASFAIAQEELPVGRAFQLALTKGSRTLGGLPGPNYWQNGTRYDLKVAFNPKNRLLNGQVEIKYRNNSPDTLQQIRFKLYPNLYKAGVASKSKIAKKDLGQGLVFERFKINGKERTLDSLQIDGTNMIVNVPSLLPGKEMTFMVNYHYFLNEGSHIRTGRIDDGSFFIAYFFPRIAVYDDIDGWNKYPYTGEEEFYNDFSDFNVEISVPRHYAVWATGDLKNAGKVFDKAIIERLELAEHQDGVVTIITEQLKAAGRGVKDRAFNTFKFEAKNVVDFAFALSDHYVWKAASVVVDSLSGRRTRVDAVFNSQHRDYYEVIDFALKSVKEMSHSFPKWPFPYSHMTVFDGLDQMEYPMMANDNPTKTRQDAITLTSHEIFHTMFPFYMGTNETKYAWMDEGWATFGEWKLTSKIDHTLVDDYGIQSTATNSGKKNDSPIMTPTFDLTGIATFTNSYPKPALGYLFVEEYLGEELFLKALHHYIHNWNGKHPQPLDFFHSMNEGSGKNLNWFWKRWFYEDGVTDMAITGVDKVDNGYHINVLNKSSKPLPVHLTIYFEDGAIETSKHTIGIWESGNNHATVHFLTGKKIKKVVLGGTYIPDKYQKDNTFILN
ncbi:M1 family metallopeptidase [Olivibacter sp. SDN3]|uniref:M1 family metallopeptidase n=1 Tax=Olivibacter sp. SDN3 TaxID=2764720 RepID=UPI0016519F66|nr:M1 family metallopeptidase [Olivibacter sp. SDN3]QNL49548.1 M1 family metallopeptidase [Olivibacter sp. SDN3]